MITLPGLIDTHVHLREPGATQKEDFETGTKAAIAGGYTAVCDMPNNPEPTVSPEALEKKILLAQSVIQTESGEAGEVEGSHLTESGVIDSSTRGLARNDNANPRIYCDLGFHFGGTPESSQYFKQIKDKVFGLKVYMNHTTGTLLQEDLKTLETIFSAWPKDKVLMVHAEGPTLKKAILQAQQFGNKIHVCHVSLASEISLIKQAKAEGLSITCEVTCHHLFLTEDDVKTLGPFGMMRPPLATQADQQALWNGIQDGTVDTIASDHAPHTKEEKQSTPTPNGVPGLETTLPLLLTAVAEGRLTINDITRLCHINPAKIFGVNSFDYSNNRTEVEVDLKKSYTIDSSTLYTKCGWTPFDGKKVTGKIKRVVLNGKVVFKDGEFLNPPQGKVIYPQK